MGNIERHDIIRNVVREKRGRMGYLPATYPTGHKLITLTQSEEGAYYMGQAPIQSQAFSPEMRLEQIQGVRVLEHSSTLTP